MKQSWRKKVYGRVPYHGQRPHTQGKSLHPLLCFSWNVKNAFKRAFPGLQDCKRKKKEKSRFECLMDLFHFDLNQLLIYENRNKKYHNDCIIGTLRIMKMKVKEVKSLAASSKCLALAEVMLKRRDRLKCVSRSFRRQLIDHMANYDLSDHSTRIMCEIMRQLDCIETDIQSLCGFRKGKLEEECSSDNLNLLQEVCKEKVPEEKFPAICAEVMRPYDPTTDEDAKSIHLRYIPALDSFKADMARNPCALRLPLMSPALKRIMNKMRPSYLMDDVPCKSCDESLNFPTESNVTVGFAQFTTLPENDFPFEAVKKFQNSSFQLPNGNDIPKLWLLASRQLSQI